MPSVSPAQHQPVAGKLHTLACATCFAIRHYSRSDVDRGRATARCRKCAARAAANKRKRRTQADKTAYQAVYYQSNKMRLDAYNRSYYQTCRLEMVAAYGGRCATCDEADPVVLVVDHVYDDGAHERRQDANGPLALYRKLKKAGWPRERHQLLCCNCNQRKEHHRRANAVRIR